MCSIIHVDYSNCAIVFPVWFKFKIEPYLLNNIRVYPKSNSWLNVLRTDKSDDVSLCSLIIQPEYVAYIAKKKFKLFFPDRTLIERIDQHSEIFGNERWIGIWNCSSNDSGVRDVTLKIWNIAKLKDSKSMGPYTFILGDKYGLLPILRGDLLFTYSRIHRGGGVSLADSENIAQGINIYFLGTMLQKISHVSLDFLRCCDKISLYTPSAYSRELIEWKFDLGRAFSSFIDSTGQHIIFFQYYWQANESNVVIYNWKDKKVINQYFVEGEIVGNGSTYMVTRIDNEYHYRQASIKDGQMVNSFKCDDYNHVICRGDAELLITQMGFYNDIGNRYWTW